MKKWALCVMFASFALAGSAAAQTGASGPVPVSGAYQPRPGTEKNDAMRMSDTEREARVVSERTVREIRERGSTTSRRDRPRPASAADLVVGAAVRDLDGVLLGTIESVDAAGVQILAGGNRARLPADGFGKNRAGLLVNLHKAEFDRAVAASLAP